MIKPPVALFSRWTGRQAALTEAFMKSCLGLIGAILLSIIVVGGGGLLWYLSETTEFSRKAQPVAAARALTPKPLPARSPAKR